MKSMSSIQSRIDEVRQERRQRDSDLEKLDGLIVHNESRRELLLRQIGVLRTERRKLLSVWEVLMHAVTLRLPLWRCYLNMNRTQQRMLQEDVDVIEPMLLTMKAARDALDSNGRPPAKVLTFRPRNDGKRRTGGGFGRAA